jgi:hypothetical protein
MTLLRCQALSAARAATPIAGVAWTPLSRSDLVWVDESRTSGVAVGEFDGVVRPALAAFGGAWISNRVGLVGSLGVARLQSTTWSGDTWRQRHWGVFRPEVDLRISLTGRAVGRPSPWLFLGLYGDIPSARDTSNGYSEVEQDAADEDAWAERARLGGIGGRLGAGVDYRLREGLALGATWSLGYHRGFLQTSDMSVVSSWLATEAALLLTFEWPRAPEG